MKAFYGLLAYGYANRQFNKLYHSKKIESAAGVIKRDAPKRNMRPWVITKAMVLGWVNP